MERVNSVLRQLFCGSSLNNRLLSYGFSSVGLVLHSIRKVFSSLSLVFSNERQGSREARLLDGCRSKFLGISRTGTHLPPLRAYKQSGHGENDEGCASPFDSGPLEAAHFSFYFLEIGCGCWLLCWLAPEWLSYGDVTGAIKAWSAVIGGFGLCVHGGFSVSQKLLTPCLFSYYNNYMANVLSTDKQSGIIGALCEGSSIRSIERTTGVHRDTIMRLGVKVGKGCMALMDAKMQQSGLHADRDG